MCGEYEMRRKPDKLPKNKKAAAVLFLLAAVILTSFFSIERRIRKYSAEMGEYCCRAQLVEAISSSVAETLEKSGAEYGDLSADIFDENGNFVSSEICTKNVSMLQSMIISEITKSIVELAETDIEVSAGTLSGIFLLNGRGPKIRFKLIPTGSAETKLKSSFESAGINQVCHKISLDIHAEIKTVCPSGAQTVAVDMNCLLAENIIAGDVPEGFIGEVQSHRNQTPEYTHSPPRNAPDNTPQYRAPQRILVPNGTRMSLSDDLYLDKMRNFQSECTGS